jgi:ketosteroid isomerase-like protein
MKTLLPALLLSIAVDASAQTDLDVAAIVDAERAFAADVAEMGMRDGTLRHLMEESVVFRPLPVAARGWYAAQDTPDFLLQWQPWFAELAASGDFGWSLGPWRSSTLEEGLRPDGHGFYTTVWMKDADGEWKVLVDHGVSVESAPTARDEVTAMGAGRSEPGAGSFLLNTRYQGLMAAALRLPSAQRPDGAEVERSWLAEDLIVLRPGRAPVQGHDAVRQIMLGDLGASAPDLTVMAASGDLGVSLGGEPAHGAYLRVWRHDANAGWQLAVDVAVPVAGTATERPDASDSDAAPSSEGGDAANAGDATAATGPFVVAGDRQRAS